MHRSVEGKGSRVLNLAVSIARSKVNVLQNAVVKAARIEFTRGAALKNAIGVGNSSAGLRTLRLLL